MTSAPIPTGIVMRAYGAYDWQTHINLAFGTNDLMLRCPTKISAQSAQSKADDKSLLKAERRARRAALKAKRHY